MFRCCLFQHVFFSQCFCVFVLVAGWLNGLVDWADDGCKSVLLFPTYLHTMIYLHIIPIYLHILSHLSTLFTNISNIYTSTWSEKTAWFLCFWKVFPKPVYRYITGILWCGPWRNNTFAQIDLLVCLHLRWNIFSGVCPNSVCTPALKNRFLAPAQLSVYRSLLSPTVAATSDPSLVCVCVYIVFVFAECLFVFIIHNSLFINPHPVISIW